MFYFSFKNVGRFGAFETFKSKMVDEDGSLSARNRVLCGAGSVLKTKLFKALNSCC